ncbi:hypothetical protein IQ269_16645 [Tychonema sp. LEGE 07199]|uniref:hypothetical protein n=1 Tax=unclassified Tychonema TaxID=2642144 RepID=UPI00187F8DDE|nr:MULTISPECIES: hypothetical protein [unclassified Tychonema]MBE9122384.1 hypothetical protein [Tychonema sp. LEGE 07199]MBE9134458.1 hypothetical protein [Tychonema sp. LEGE 07196]
MQKLAIHNTSSLYRSTPGTLKFIGDRCQRQVATIVMRSGSIADCTASFPA